MRVFYAGVGILVMAVAVAAQTTKPSEPQNLSVEQKQAYDELAAMYADSSHTPDIRGALERLNSGEVLERQSAGRFILALFTQSLADETNGRAQWQNEPFWGGGSDSPARNFRQSAAEQFGHAARTEEAIDPAVWLIDNDPVPEDEAAGILALRGIQSPRMAEVLRRYLAPAHPNSNVVIGAIEEAGQRRLTQLDGPIEALCTDFRQPVREAALKEAAELGVAAPAFHAESAITPAVAVDLTDIAAMVRTPIPSTALWKRFAFTPAQPPGTPPGDAVTRSFSGWFLERRPDSYRVLNLFGEVRDYPKSQTTMSDRTFQDEAKEFAQIRSAAPDDMRDSLGKLSRRGTLTGQFEPDFVSVPEALVAAWSYARGDKATAAAVIFPCYSLATDERWIKQAVRDMIAFGYQDEVLRAFCYERHYPQAIAIARHLASPPFDGYRYQERYRLLSQQLARRADEDFKTFTLPTPAQWKQLQSTLDRVRRIEYLAQHLRLLNCFQMMQPGGVSYSDPQSDIALSPTLERRGLTQQEYFAHIGKVINPFTELLAMNLEVRDLPVLVPFLANDDFMPTYSYWRDFDSNRTLHKVNGAVALIVNHVAVRKLADVDAYSSLDAAGKRRYLNGILAWTAANNTVTRQQLLLDAAANATDWDGFRKAAGELVASKSKAAMPMLLKRMADFSDNRAEIARFCYELAPQEVLPQARQWVKEWTSPPSTQPSADEAPGQSMRYWGAMILLNSGDRAKLEGVAEMRRLVEQTPRNHFDPEIDIDLARAIDQLLANGQPAAANVAWMALDAMEPNDPFYGAVAQKLLFAGHDEALNSINRRLMDTSGTEGTYGGQYQGKETERQIVQGDEIAMVIAEWRTDGPAFDPVAPDDARAAARAQLKQWLTDQYALIKAGKPCAIKRDTQEVPTSSTWQLDAP